MSRPPRILPHARSRPVMKTLLPIAGLFLILSGCASSTGGPTGSSPSAAPVQDGEAQSREAQPRDGSTAELEALFRARLEEGRQRFTAADQRFMTDMIHHHAQAIEISLLAPERAESDAVRRLAARIINAQRDEIRTTQRWLAARDLPGVEVDLARGLLLSPEGMEHAGHGIAHGPDGEAARGTGHDAGDPLPGMPGMLSPEQVQALREATGGEFDRLFLTGMIEHHQGAVRMVHDLFATDGAGQDEEVFRFASDVQVDQVTEVARMESMLAELDASGSR